MEDILKVNCLADLLENVLGDTGEYDKVNYHRIGEKCCFSFYLKGKNKADMAIEFKKNLIVGIFDNLDYGYEFEVVTDEKLKHLLKLLNIKEVK